MDPLFGLAGRWQGLGQSGFLRQCREDTDDRDSRVDEHRLRRLGETSTMGQMRTRCRSCGRMTEAEIDELRTRSVP
jgi:hypothetical protein